MIATEQWKVFEEHAGLFTARDSDDIPDGFSPNLLNIRITGSHFRGAKGYEIRGTRNATAGEISSQYTFNRNDGKQRMLRVRDDASTGTLEWYDAVNQDWYTLIPSLTTGKIMGFAEFNTSLTNQCIFCNGIENISVWTGATTRLTAAVAATDTTINVADTTDFPVSGTIIYNGTEIAYSAKTATTFTVASAHASSGATDGVAQAADDSTHSSVTKGNILLSAKDRLWIAGQPSGPNNLDYSDEGAPFTYTGGAQRTDSGTEDFYNIGGEITGLSEKESEIIVLGEDGADGFSFTYPTSTTKAPVFREVFRSKGRGCTNHKSVVKVSNDIYFTNRNGLVSISDLEGSEKLIQKSVMRDILPTVKEYDFSEASSVFFDSESILLVSCKSNPDFPANDLVLGMEFFKTKDGADTFSFTRLDWPTNDFAILNDADGIPELHFGSSLEQNSHKAFETYQNDGAPRNIRYATKRYNFKNPFQEKSCRLMAVKGLIKDGTDVTVKLLHNAGFLGEQTKTIESTGAYVSSNVLNTIGAFALGTNPIGATIDEVAELKQFLVYLDWGVDYAPNDMQLVFESDTDGGTFLIDSYAMAVDMQGYASRDDITI